MSTIKKRILDVAGRLFFERGFSRVSMDEVARELGISKKTLYQHFLSKKALLSEIVSLMLTENAKIVDDIVNDDRMDFFLKLSRLLDHISDMLGRMARPFGEDLRRNAPEMWEEIDQFRQKKIFQNFGNLMESGIQQGVFRPNADPQLLTLMFSSLVHNLIDPRLFGQLPFTASQVFEFIVEVIFRGIMTEPARMEFIKKYKRR